MAEKLSDIGQAALDAVKRGWGVFPLRARSKKPATKHGFQNWTNDPESVATVWGAYPNFNLAIATGLVSGVVVIDVDYDGEKGYDGYETLREWEREHGELPETVTEITGRGGMHYFYRVDRETPTYKNTVDHIDVRGDGGYAMIAPSVHPDTGRVVEWENHPDDYEVAWANDNVYALIEHFHERKVSADTDENGNWELPQGDVNKGDRDETLFKYASLMRTNRTPRDVASAVLHAYNEAHCKPPMPKRVVEQKLDSAWKYAPGTSFENMVYEEGCKDDGKAQKSQLVKGNTVRHNVFGQVLIAEDRACFIEGAPAIWDGSRYATGWKEVQRAIVRRVDRVKRKDQNEICHYLSLNAPEKEPSDPSLIGFANGVLDLYSGELTPYTPDMVITNIIPHDFDWNAYDETVDTLLGNISCHDDAIRSNLEETMGLCMYRTNEYGTCPVLIGGGSNGKSTYINMLRNVLGDDNTSSLDLSIIGKNFQAGRLLGKLANLGDDISNEFLRGDVLAVFKKVVTGERIYTDVKNGEGFEFRPYCTLVFSCNEMPNLGDASEGVMRRLFPIPFDAKFSAADAAFDPQIGRKVCSEQAAMYLCKLGIYGLQRVVAQNGMSPNRRSRAIVDELTMNNNNVLAWMRDAGHDAEWLVGRACNAAFEEYSDWCTNSNAKAVSKTMFGRRVKTLYGLTDKRERDANGRQRRVYARHDQ